MTKTVGSFQLATQSHKRFSSRQLSAGMWQKCCVFTSYFIIKGSRFNKMNTCYCFIKNILKWNWLSPVWCGGERNTDSTTQFGTMCCLAWFLLSFQQPHYCFYSAVVNMVPKASNISVLLWKSYWPPGCPERVLVIPRFLSTTFWKLMLQDGFDYCSAILKKCI